MESFTYTIRRVAGGRGHFARVQVGIAQDGSNPVEVPFDKSKLLPEWIDAAKSGIEFALHDLERNDRVVILSIDGSLADTFEDAVFCAAAVATFRLFDENARIELFDGEKWIVTDLGENTS
ncbi:hypothetical protein DTL42_13280 [Bremerella cremea]|uniref:Uncharacterized protein n=1 Tax=Bremerella cremea TaxID=1031537 RepID=A0A368KRR2_9BACT|nr:hypothetical protein [Bremerella cremea]RCS49491.1 hypothetical protein DTL42_13280 [Bremerella cremea]